MNRSSLQLTALSPGCATGETQYETVRQEFPSGRELIERVKARLEQAQAYCVIADEIETEMGAGAEKLNARGTDVQVVLDKLWVSDGVPKAEVAHRLGIRLTTLRKHLS